jgi:branched-chain amino acid transport system substrate-binding protein
MTGHFRIMRRSRWLTRASLIAMGCVIIALPSACGSSPGTSGGKPKSIGIAIGGPFTGSAAIDGQEIYQGAALAADLLNAAGGISRGPLKDAKIKLIKYDDKDDPQTGVTVARQVISNSSILAYAGSAISDVSVAQAPIFERAGMPFLSVYASANTILEPAKHYVFVVPPTFAAYSDSIADTMSADHIRSVGIVHLTGTYGQLITDYLVQRLKQLHIAIVANESFNFGDTDLRAQLARVKAANPKALAMVGFTDSDTLMLKQAKDLGLRVPTYDPGGIVFSHDFLSAAGPLANGVTGNTPSNPHRGTQATRRLVAAWQQKYHTSVVPDPGAFGWEAIHAIAAAVAAGGDTRASLAQKLHSVSIADTGIGPLRFDKTGARVGGRLWIFRIENSVFDFIASYEQRSEFDVVKIG